MDELHHSKAHEQFEQRLNAKGCEFGRVLELHLRNYEETNDSDVISVKAGQKLFVESIFPKMQHAVKEANDMVEKVHAAASKAQDAAERSEKAALSTKKDMWGLVLSLIGAVLLLLVLNGITAVAKYNQDAGNQNRTESILKGMAKHLNIPLDTEVSK